MNVVTQSQFLPAVGLLRGKPRGQATFEYVVVAASVVLIWLAIERSPEGLTADLFKLLSQYKFLISIPW